MTKIAPIVNQEKADRFNRMFPPRIKQMAKQIKLIDFEKWELKNETS